MEEKLKHILLNDLSRTSKTYVVEWIGQDINRAGILWEWMLQAEDPLKWRSAWIFEEVCVKQPSVLNHFSSRIVQLFPKLQHIPMRRMIGKLVSMIDVPETDESQVLDAALTWLQDTNQPPAVRVHCMQVAYNFSVKYPDLAYELIAILEHLLDTGSKGFKNRAGKLLQKLRKT